MTVCHHIVPHLRLFAFLRNVDDVIIWLNLVRVFTLPDVFVCT